MKKRYKIIFWLFSILLGFFLLAQILITTYAPRIIEQQIERNFKLKASLGSISIRLPFTIILERLEIGDLASIKRVSLSPNLLAWVFGKFVVHGLRIIEPRINLEQSADGKLNLPVLAKKSNARPIYLTSLNLVDGKIFFTDKKISAVGFQVVINKLNVKVAKVVFPLASLATNFNASAELLSSQGQACGELDFSGRLEYLAKDLDAQLVVKNLDLTGFSVYYGNFISQKKLTSAQLDLVSIFKARNNILKISTKFNLSKLAYAPDQEQQLDSGIMKSALDLFADPQGNLSLEFDIDTLLDNPALSREQVQKIIFKAASKNLAEQPPQQLIDKVNTLIDQYKGLGKELKAIFD